MAPDAAGDGRNAREFFDMLVRGLQDYVAELVEQGKAKPEDFDEIYEILNEPDPEEKK